MVGAMEEERKHEGGVGKGKDEQRKRERYNNNNNYNNNQYLGMVGAWHPEAEQ
jgi:hypothetical protein